MSDTELIKIIPDEPAMLKFAETWASVCGNTLIIFLQGALGAGKTTLARGFLRGLGFTGKVNSPSYTIVEPYELPQHLVFHFDLYRLHDPRELEFIGAEDYFIPEAICLIEWPENALEFLPQADLSCYLEILESGRHVKLISHSERGKIILQQLKKII